tara:strand:- start:6278 stop:7366 length:1089 start_codon:yes stop_codon:yes gene_type:complete
MAAFSTYYSGNQDLGTGYQKTRKEFLYDQISYKYPSEVPLIRMLPKVSVDSTEIDWVLGNLTPDFTITASAENENFSSTPAPSGMRKRAGNYTHLKHKVIEVTDTQRAMDEVGTSDEYSTQIWQKSRELAIEVENTLYWSREVIGTAGSPNRQTHGLFAWAYDTGDTAGAVTIAGHLIPEVYDSVYHAPIGAAVDMTLPDLTEITRLAWAKGIDIDRSVMMCGDKLYNLISGFGLQTFGTTPDIRTVPLNERTIPAAARSLEHWLEVYQGPFGRIHINKNRYFTDRTPNLAAFGPGGNQITLIPEKAFVIFEPEQLAIGILQGMHVRPGATSTFSSVAAVATQFALIVRDPRGLAAGHNWVA